MDNAPLPTRVTAHNNSWEMGMKAQLALSNSQVILPIKEISGRPGEVTRNELTLLAYTAQLYQIKRFFEIGTFKGTTALAIALNMHPEGHVYTLDIPVIPPDLTGHDREYCQPENVGSAFKDIPELQNKITQLWGDSRYFGFSQFYNRMDMVFVDGDHKYETIVSDLNNALKMIKPDGIVVCHDFAVWRPEVMQAVGDVLGATGEPIYTFQWTMLAMYGKNLGSLFDD